MYCTNCGNANPDDAKFCGGCGTPLTVTSSGHQPVVYGEDEELKLFVGQKSDYYLNKWKTEKNNRSWNWAAFFAGLFWVGYRKMYKVIFITLGIFILIDILTLFLDTSIADKLNYAITIGLAFSLGISGNYFYSQNAKKKIQKIKAANPHNPETQRKEIEKQGGSSWKGVFVAVGLLVVYGGINMGLFTLQDYALQNKGSSQPVVAQSSNDTNANDSTDEEVSDESAADTTDTAGTTVEVSSDAVVADSDQEVAAEEDVPAEVSYEEVFQSYMSENGITLTAKDVQYDMKNNLDKDFAILGKAELDTYYNYGFADAESNYFSVDITPFDGEYGDNWNLYFSRKDFSELFNLLKTSGEVTIAATGIIPSNVYEPDQGNLASAKKAVWGD